MELIIEITTKNILNNNEYNQMTKKEFISMINRISFVENQIQQLKRTLDNVILYNVIYDEINYMLLIKKFFKKNLNHNVKIIINNFINSKINYYNQIIINL